MSEGLNQRRHTRVPIRMAVRISTIDPELDPETGKPYFRTSEETCANVSRGGAFVVTPEPIAPGRRLLLELEMPEGRTVQTIGRVAWVKITMSPPGKKPAAGIGVEFLGGSPEQLSALETFLSKASRRRRSARASKTPTPEPPTQIA
jgi:Tfp pilus assembly protein PilZ